MSDGEETRDWDGRRIYDMVDVGNERYVVCPSRHKQLRWVHDHWEIRPRARAIWWLRAMGDGRYLDDQAAMWWVIEDAEYDDDEEYIFGEVIGCARP